MEYLIREIKEQEYPLLDDFLYEAVFVPKGAQAPPRSIIRKPELQIYVRDFGKKEMDKGIVAEADGRIIGAVWVRIMHDYGHIDDETPSFAISLYPEYRGLGIGTAMMREMLCLLKKSGCRRASLSVQKANYAVKMYRKAGFEITDENEEEFIMVCDLQETEQEMPKIRLVTPVKIYEKQVMEYRTEMLACGSSFDGCAGLEDVDSYDEWLDFETRLRKKYGDGYVPSDVYLAVRTEDGHLTGIIDYRKGLSDFLFRFGGNIGYSVRPSERRKGYAKEMLALLCGICKSEGAARVLITCDKDNEASRKTILHNGGVLENEVEDTAGLGRSGVIQRYWIVF